jgi:hypothetical protein
MKTLTSTLVIAALLAVCASAQAPRVARGSKLYIEGDTPFGVALSAAIVKKKVPAVVTTNRDDADFIVDEASDRSRRKPANGSLRSSCSGPSPDPAAASRRRSG